MVPNRTDIVRRAPGRLLAAFTADVSKSDVSAHPGYYPYASCAAPNSNIAVCLSVRPTLNQNAIKSILIEIEYNYRSLLNSFVSIFVRVFWFGRLDLYNIIVYKIK